MSSSPAPVVGVLGAVGGVGTSSLAAAIAARWGRGTLIDLDLTGGGLDVALGLEGAAGVRWSGLHAAGGRVDPVDLVRRLPRWGGVGVLAADGADVAASALSSILAAAPAAGPVVVDLGRGGGGVQRAALAQLHLLVVVSVADVRGVTAARVAVSWSGGTESGIGVAAGGMDTGLVLRRADMPPGEAAAACGIPPLGSIGAMPRRRGAGRLSEGRSLRRVADVITARVAA